MSILNLLGFAPDNVPVIFDVAYESLGIKSFAIWRNIPEDKRLVLFKDSDFYIYTFHEPGSPFIIDENPIFLGVVNYYGKTKVFEYFQQNYAVEPISYINLIHKTSYIAHSAELSHGILIEPHVIISSQSKIGFAVTIKRGASIGHHNKIQEYVEINPGAILAGRVCVGKNCIIGAGSVVRNGISIGENSVIGMGSVVTKDIPPNVVAFGSPCKVVRENIIRI